jgi:hypothetical protein
MIVQAIGLLDDLDKELNTYAMRVREWYGWHFPEMTRVVSDNLQYAKTVRRSYRPGAMPPQSRHWRLSLAAFKTRFCRALLIPPVRCSWTNTSVLMCTCLSRTMQSFGLFVRSSLYFPSLQGGWQRGGGSK